MLRFGIVDQVGTGEHRGRVRVRFEAADEVLSGWLFVPSARSFKGAFYWMPAIGESVGCVTDEDLAEGLVFPHYNTQDTPPVCPDTAFHVAFEDGTFIQYDPEAHELVAQVVGTVDLRAVGRIRVQSMDGLEFSGAGPVKLNALDDMTVAASGKLTIEAYDGVVVNAHQDARITAETIVTVEAPSIALMGAVGITGKLDVAGPASFVGAVDVVGKLSADLSSATHIHPVSGGMAQKGQR